MKLLTMVWADDTLVGGVVTPHMSEVRKLYDATVEAYEGKQIWTSTKIIGE